MSLPLDPQDDEWTPFDILPGLMVHHFNEETRTLRDLFPKDFPGTEAHYRASLSHEEFVDYMNYLEEKRIGA